MIFSRYFRTCVVSGVGTSFLRQRGPAIGRRQSLIWEQSILSLVGGLVTAKRAKRPLLSERPRVGSLSAYITSQCCCSTCMPWFDCTHATMVVFVFCLGICGVALTHLLEKTFLLFLTCCVCVNHVHLILRPRPYVAPTCWSCDRSLTSSTPVLVTSPRRSSPRWSRRSVHRITPAFYAAESRM